MDIVENVGKRIRLYRENQKISREVLAERASLHPTYIGQLERGEKNPTLETLFKISNGLKVPINFLIELPSQPQDQSILSKCVNLIENQSIQDQEYIYDILTQIISYKNR